MVLYTGSVANLSLSPTHLLCDAIVLIFVVLATVEALSAYHMLRKRAVACNGSALLYCNTVASVVRPMY